MSDYWWDQRLMAEDFRVAEQIKDMRYPMRCNRCNTIHGAGPVHVVQRYADCTVWRCPNCNVLGDDRPIGWGGTFERVTVHREVEGDR